ncbi:hypothetical protein ATANTOWER_013486 [Ataeniobius toweri]|uniref:Chemokine interleukin-8-like domain-containing protein n=1 Tax=Ataeniobius toweri TaxID=208326 RepID=A0ABU7B6H0_9TELE|nr:hypothetical protein [Ataeniobius toweri]
MKTLCLSLGMLLLIACCCNAMPDAQQYNTGPVECCYKFSSVVIPKKNVSEIKKTHRSCMLKGFIVKTVMGRSFCFRESVPWVLKAYNQMQNPEGSGQQQ